MLFASRFPRLRPAAHRAAGLMTHVRCRFGASSSYGESYRTTDLSFASFMVRSSSSSSSELLHSSWFASTPSSRPRPIPRLKGLDLVATAAAATLLGSVAALYGNDTISTGRVKAGCEAHATEDFPSTAKSWDEGVNPSRIRRVLTKRPYFYNKIDEATRDRIKHNVVMVAGSSHLELSQEVANFLGIELSSLSTGRFADGESSVQIGTNVRGKDVFVLQSLIGTEDGGTLNDSIIELLLTISAARRASAGRITAVIPYFAYARQSRKASSNARTTIAAGDLAKMLHSMGVDRVLTVDLHSPEIVGCFPNTINVTNLVPTPVAAAYFGEKDLDSPCVVSPKSGGIFRAKQFCNSLKIFQPNAALVTFVKDKFSDGSTTRRLLGDVTGKDCILVDDMLDTGTTIIRAAQRLKRAGAKKVFVYVSHGIFSGTSWSTIVKSRAIDEVVVANTIPAQSRAGEQTKIRHLSLAPLIAEAMSRMVTDKSTRQLTKQ